MSYCHSAVFHDGEWGMGNGERNDDPDIFEYHILFWVLVQCFAMADVTKTRMLLDFVACPRVS